MSPTRRRGAGGTTAALAPGLDLVPVRPLVRRTVDVALPLRPGDVPLVRAGESVVAGSPLVDRIRDPRLVEVGGNGGGRPGEWLTELSGGRRGRGAGLPGGGGAANGNAGHVSTSGRTPAGGQRDGGERLFESNGRWRIASSDHHDPMDAPVTGIVREVRTGIGLSLRAAGAALSGVVALGDPTRGRLELATDRDGELVPRSLDVGSAGAILVVGARIDAEALTRARAMGIRGVVVATLPGKDRRDFLASEARQRAALHRLSPFGVLVLHGAQRRPIGEAEMALLERLAGHDVAIVGDPPALLFDPEGGRLPPEPPDAVHVRSGPYAGRRGRWAGLAGQRRFPGATHLEAGFVRFGDDPPIALPLADLERLV